MKVSDKLYWVWLDAVQTSMKLDADITTAVARADKLAESITDRFDWVGQDQPAAEDPEQVARRTKRSKK